MSRHIAGLCLAFCTLWTTWALLAPVVAGPLPFPAAPHTCPAPEIRHGVGSDLRSYQRTQDACALYLR